MDAAKNYNKIIQLSFFVAFLCVLQDVRHASPCPAAAFRAQDVRS
jgi:hypothetical protein